MADRLGPRDRLGFRARLRVYRYLFGAQIRSQVSYRTSFAIDVFSNILIPVVDMVTILLMFRVARDLGGFSAVEVLLMFCLTGVAFAIADMVVGNVERLRTYVRQGLLDAVLVRPLSVLGQLVAMDFAFRRVVRIGVTAVVLGIALGQVDVDWSPATVLLLIITPLSGAVFFSAFFVATATVAFWWIESGEFANAFTYGGRDFTSYPITVYGELFQRLFAYSLGFAFVSYYPTLTLLGRPDPLGLPSWVGWTTPAVALVAAVVAGLVWRTGLRHYRSTGS